MIICGCGNSEVGAEDRFCIKCGRDLGRRQLRRNDGSRYWGILDRLKWWLLAAVGGIIVLSLAAQACSGGEPSEPDWSPTDAEMRAMYAEGYQCLQEKDQLRDFLGKMAEVLMEESGGEWGYSQALDRAWEVAGDEDGFVDLMMRIWEKVPEEERAEAAGEFRLALFWEGITGCYW